MGGRTSGAHRYRSGPAARRVRIVARAVTSHVVRGRSSRGCPGRARDRVRRPAGHSRHAAGVAWRVDAAAAAVALEPCRPGGAPMIERTDIAAGEIASVMRMLRGDRGAPVLLVAGEDRPSATAVYLHSLLTLRGAPWELRRVSVGAAPAPTSRPRRAALS